MPDFLSFVHAPALPRLARLLPVLGLFHLPAPLVGAPDLLCTFDGRPVPANVAPDLALGTDFGRIQDLAVPATRIFTLTNLGDARLSSVAADVAGPGFEILRPPDAIIRPGQSTEVWVQFSPVQTGLVNGSLTVSSNDPDPAPYVVRLAGEGSPLSLEVDPTPPPAIPPRATLSAFLGPDSVSRAVRWRLVGERLWRTNGETITGIVTNRYEAEFRGANDWTRTAPGDVVVGAGSNSVVWTFDFRAFTNTGSVSVRIEPDAIRNEAAWRVQGDDSGWLPSGAVVSNLPPGLTTIKFRPVAGYRPPLIRDVRILAGERVELEGVYRPRSSNNVLTPHPVGSTNLAVEPFAFNGQVITEFGEGSGFAATTNVVLTAASVVFSDSYLGFARNVRWLHRRDRDTLHERAIEPRSVVIAQGYAAQRQRDVALLDPSGATASHESLNLNVAALGFDQPAARGAAGGFRASDALDHPRLVSDEPKLLVCYPTDDSSNDDLDRMQATEPANLQFERFNGLELDRNGNPNRLYTSPDFLANRGAVGGPIYSQRSDRFVAAGVFLGSEGDMSFVRAIDRDVRSLMSAASSAAFDAATADAPASLVAAVQPRLSGGVVGVGPGTGSGQGGFFAGGVRGELVPMAAVHSGARWRLSPADSWHADGALVTGVAVGEFHAEFRPATGFTKPGNRAISVVANQTTVLSGSYAAAGSPNPQPNPQVPPNGILLSANPTNRFWRVGAAGDLNGDGTNDVVRFKGPQLDVVQFAGLTNLGARPVANDPIHKGWRPIACADFDRDGRDELVRVRGRATQILFFDGFAPSNTVVLPRPPDGRKWTVIGAADLDGDLQPDLVAARKREFQIWRMAGTNVVAWPALAADGLLKRQTKALADLAGDATPELIQTKGKEIYGLLHNATSIVAHGQVSLNPQNKRFKIRAVADLDGDGLDDLIRQRAASLDVLITNTVVLQELSN